MEIIAYSDYEGYKKQLDRAITETTANFIVIGYLLLQARDTDILCTSGYTSMGDFARKEYGLDESVTSRFINIAERYGDGQGRLKPEYAGYTCSKLGEMLSLPSEVAAVVTPDMTVKEIRTIKEEVQEESKVSDIEVMIEAAEAGEGSDIEKFIKAYLEERTDEFRKVCKANSQEECYDILAPSGKATLIARIPGTGRVMLNLEDYDHVSAIYVRENRTEALTMTDIDNAIMALRINCDDPEERYREIYGHDMPKSEPEPKAASEKVKLAKKEKKPEKKKKEPEKAAEQKEEIATSQDEDDMPVEQIQEIYRETLGKIDQMRSLYENRYWEKALGLTVDIRALILKMSHAGPEKVKEALDAQMED